MPDGLLRLAGRQLLEKPLVTLLAVDYQLHESDASAVVRQFQPVVVAAEDVAAAVGEPESPKDLLEHNCLRYRFIRSQRIAPWDFRDGDEQFAVAVDGDFIADSLVPLVDRVLAGHGLAHIPTDLVRRYLQDGRMVKLLEDYEFQYPPLHLYYPRENKGHELLRAFVDVLRPMH